MTIGSFGGQKGGGRRRVEKPEEMGTRVIRGQGTREKSGGERKLLPV